MIRPASIIAIVVAAAALAGMMATNPDYNRAVRPMISEAGSDGIARTRTVAGKIESWRTADVIEFTRYGKKMRRDTAGVFLIVEMKLDAVGQSIVVESEWLGTSGRHYQTTDRIDGPQQLIHDSWLQPGMTVSTTAIFELPRDEIVGGAALVGPWLMMPLDGSIKLEPPAEPPRHVLVERMVDP